MHLHPNTFLHNKKYLIISTIAQGGFGITYMAKDLALDRIVAIKEFFYGNLCSRKSDSNEVLGSTGEGSIVEKLKIRFIEEAKRLAKLNHRNIVTVHDVFEENGTAYFVMEYIVGGSLEEYVKKNGCISELLVMHFIDQIAIALNHLHKRRICHLDIKPANILLTEYGIVKLIDFGLSKQYEDDNNQTSTFLAVSNGYAPLEQYTKSGVSQFQPPTDIYSFGATVYFLLSGQRPPEATVLVTTPLKPIMGVSKEVNAAISRAMSVNINDRQQTVDEFIQQIDTAKISEITKAKQKLPEDNFPRKEIEEQIDDDTEIVSKKESNSIEASRKIIFFRRLGKGLLWATVFLIFMKFVYLEASIWGYAWLFNVPVKALKISSAANTAFTLGVSIYALVFCLAYEFIEGTDKNRNFLSLFTAFIFYAVLVLVIYIIPNPEKQLVKNWFFASAAIFPIIVYFVRYIVISKLLNSFFNRKMKQ